jgi:hypothetical protein
LKALHPQIDVARLVRRVSCSSATVVLLALVTSVASCASAEDTPPPSDGVDAGSLVPADDAASTAGGGCEADASCTMTDEPSCDDVEWCPTKTGHPVGIGLSAVWGSGPNDVWIVGAFGSVTHYDGNEWKAVPVDTHSSLFAVWGSGPNDVWTMSAPNQIVHTTGFANGTAQWSPVAPVVDQTIDPPQIGGVIWGTSASDVWITGKRIGVQRDNFSYEQGWRTVIADGGTSWQPVVQQEWVFDTVRGVWGSGPDDVWIVGSKGDGLPFALHTDGVAAAGGGVPVWTELDVQTLYSLYGVWGSGPADVWAVGDKGTIRHYTANTKQWLAAPSSTTENLRGIWGSGPSDIWAVGENGTLLHYDGRTWSPATAAFSPGDKPNLYGVWGSGPNDVWAVGSGHVLHFSGPKPDAEVQTP